MTKYEMTKEEIRTMKSTKEHPIWSVEKLREMVQKADEHGYTWWAIYHDCARADHTTDWQTRD